MNGCRGASRTATGWGSAGCPENRGSGGAPAPGGIAWGGTAPAGAAATRAAIRAGRERRASIGVSRPGTRPAAPSSGGSPRLRGLRVGRSALLVLGRDRHERRLDAAIDGVLGHDALLDVAPRGQLELHLEQDLLDDRAQAARARLALERLVGDRLERVGREDELDPVEAEEALELLDDRVARLGEDRDQIVARELVDGRGDRQAADELGDQAVLHEVLGQALLEDLARGLVGLGLDRRAEADALVADPALDDLVEVREGAAADEQDVRRVDGEELLVGVLAPALGRDGG